MNTPVGHSSSLSRCFSCPLGFNDDDGETASASCSAPMPGQLLMFPMTSKVWTDASPCPGCISSGLNTPLSVGPEIAFGRELISRGVSTRIGFIPTAVGGTDLFRQWMPPNGEEFQNMIQTVQLAMGSLNKSDNAVLRGLIWVQGETDATDQRASYYWPNLQNMMLTTRVMLSSFNPLLPVIMAIQSAKNRVNQFPFISFVRDAQSYTANHNDSFISVDMEDFEFYFQDYGRGPSWTHLTKRGECKMGQAMAQSWINWTTSATEAIARSLVLA